MSGREVAEERFARGEIDKDEMMRIIAALPPIPTEPRKSGSSPATWIGWGIGFLVLNAIAMPVAASIIPQLILFNWISIAIAIGMIIVGIVKSSK